MAADKKAFSLPTTNDSAFVWAVIGFYEGVWQGARPAMEAHQKIPAPVIKAQDWVLYALIDRFKSLDPSAQELSKEFLARIRSELRDGVCDNAILAGAYVPRPRQTPSDQSNAMGN